MRLATWNVNGIRAIVKKDFTDSIRKLNADVIGFQETKAQDDQVREALFGLEGLEEYQVFSSSAVKKGLFGYCHIIQNSPLYKSMQGLVLKS